MSNIDKELDALFAGERLSKEVKKAKTTNRFNRFILIFGAGAVLALAFPSLLTFATMGQWGYTDPLDTFDGGQKLALQKIGKYCYSPLPVYRDVETCQVWLERYDGTMKKPLNLEMMAASASVTVPSGDRLKALMEPTPPGHEPLSELLGGE